MLYSPELVKVLEPIGQAVMEFGKMAVETAGEFIKNTPIKEIVTTAATEVTKDYINSYNNNRANGYSMVDSASNAFGNTIDKYTYEFAGTTVSNNSPSYIPAIYYVDDNGRPINTPSYYMVNMPR